MPESVYKLVFNNLQTAKLAKNDIDLTVYTRCSVDLISKCTFYMLSKGTKQPIKVEFYIAKEEGSHLHRHARTMIYSSWSMKCIRKCLSKYLCL